MEAVIRKNASLADVQKVHEEQQACALAMGADRDARSLDAIKVQRAERPTAKPMVEGEGVSILGALKAPRETQITA